MTAKGYCELDRAQLTKEQKLGLLLCANLSQGEKDVEDALTMIREHRLGAVWIATHMKNRDDVMRRVHEAADYPILILCDAENGAPGHEIPSAISLSAANARNEYARAFGRLTSSYYARLGYNCICHPVLDRQTENHPCGGATRIISPHKEIVARLGGEIARGMHEGGTLAVAKHYPSPMKGKPWDSHMREGFADDTREDLLTEGLYPYRRLIEEDVIDGVMVGHALLPNIDPERPASLSRPVMDILRECGFHGFYISDALGMMGVVLKYGHHKPTAMAVAAGCDIPLSWSIPCREAYEVLLTAYRSGEITDEQLELSVGRVLDAQHKVTLLPQSPTLREEDAECIRRLNRECISGVIESGLAPTVSREGKHLFIIMVDAVKPYEEEFDTFAGVWYKPDVIEARLRELFPNSDVMTHPNFPNPSQNLNLFNKQAGFDDIVYITYCKSECFIGRECLTQRTVDLMDALQSKDRIVAHLHFGNPFVATDAPYVPRVLLGWGSEGCVMHTLEILAGNAELCGIQPYADFLHFHKKGDIL